MMGKNGRMAEDNAYLDLEPLPRRQKICFLFFIIQQIDESAYNTRTSFQIAIQNVPNRADQIFRTGFVGAVGAHGGFDGWYGVGSIRCEGAEALEEGVMSPKYQKEGKRKKSIIRTGALGRDKYNLLHCLRINVRPRSRGCRSSRRDET
jgi:hypothetical protein